MTPWRIVLDANVVVSALIRPASAPGRIVRAAVAGVSVRLVASAPLMAELRAVLRYPRLRRFLRMGEQDREEFVLLLEQVADLVNPADQPATGLCRDPADEPYLQTAFAGRADFLVSGDRDLLVLRQVETVPILAPAEFDRLLARRRPPR